MKQFLSAALALACTALIVSLVVMKHGDDARHERDSGAIADFSNRLDSAQTKIAICEGTMNVFSNKLNESRSASSTFSNRLTEAESTIALDTEQITNLNRHIAEVESENQTLGQTLDRRVMDLTNQVASLTSQIGSTEATLDQANRDYTLLENRLRRDVAERIVVERKFGNPLELQAQVQNLKKNPAGVVSAESIYAGLGVEVLSNGAFHVLAPD